MSVTITPTDVRDPAVIGLIMIAVDELNRRYGVDPLDPEGEVSHLSTEELTPPHGQFFVARDEAGHLIGGVAVRRVLDEEAAAGEIKRLWGRPDRRRDGIAHQLMRTAEDWARDTGYRQLYLETGWAQPEALAFYEREGWERIENFPDGMYNYPSGFKFTRVL